MGRFNELETERIFNGSPFMRELGLEASDIQPGRCETRILLAERHQQQDGFVHAGVQASMADHTGGAAAASLVNDDQLVLTAEFKINLLRAASGERLRCCATVLKSGISLMVVESEVFCGDAACEKLVAKATVTLVVVAKSHYINRGDNS